MDVHVKRIAIRSGYATHPLSILAMIISRIPALCSPYVVMIQKLHITEGLSVTEGCFIIAH